ncbi:hypothetical protein HOO54_23745 [Bacillus sp. WMMC1349]|uniref:host-nuclease inhibitor Gam family protein n=1 Tax=Bacillus sp. WMMC1349 TaxID=2736254 RepID=UPI001556C486|nr:host-nuclease inhibitor Gam family protein [Bacillus sp. WMMC1349]NPC90991.1 hypothetical protein [Bacillus sp. WMMC1349]NPC91036.1 hypothetical protein [Bacillus sp. WMMC1349]NPC94975.1 hypothetical protein [Bacillus sp. WMMC1349]NPC95037.1 hypothetical protein [Bacillus sp. WMMC1349]NPC95071.1 hypothetical protein [Bacillus sp. WMMC1349]
MSSLPETEQVLIDQVEEEEKDYEVFEVTDLESAAEAQRRITYFKGKQSEIDAVAEKQLERLRTQIERVEFWRDESKKPYVERENFYIHRLERYMREEVRRQIESGKKPYKSINLPYGKIKLTKQQPEYQRNETDLLKYAETKGLVKIKKDVDWASIKKKSSVFGDKLIDADGEIISGVTVVDREDKFTVEVNE